MERSKFKFWRMFGIRFWVSAAVIAVMIIMHFCGARIAGAKNLIASGGNTVEAVRYIVGKYNEFTAQ